jgi:hypothetical protein
MNNAPNSLGISSGEADVPWSKLVLDLVLLAIGVLSIVASVVIDIRGHHHDYFARSGAVAVLMSGLLAYRSLTKHYRKLFNLPETNRILRTSRNQAIVDRCTLWLSIVGTLVWAYGDKLFSLVGK